MHGIDKSEISKLLVQGKNRNHLRVLPDVNAEQRDKFTSDRVLIRHSLDLQTVGFLVVH